MTEFSVTVSVHTFKVFLFYASRRNLNSPKKNKLFGNFGVIFGHTILPRIPVQKMYPQNPQIGCIIIRKLFTWFFWKSYWWISSLNFCLREFHVLILLLYKFSDGVYIGESIYV